eukprot:480414-Rhodomonas_salina.3
MVWEEEWEDGERRKKGGRVDEGMGGAQIVLWAAESGREMSICTESGLEMCVLKCVLDVTREWKRTLCLNCEDVARVTLPFLRVFRKPSSSSSEFSCGR